MKDQTGMGTRRDPDLSDRPVKDDMTVLIPTLGRDLIADCLRAIEQGTALPGKLIVVDQGKSLSVNSWVRSLRSRGIDAEYVPSSQRGVASGRNRGIERVRTRFVVITDDDCLVEPDWLERMTDGLRKHPNRVLTGKVIPWGGSGEIGLGFTSSRPRTYTRPLLTRCVLIPGNMGCAREIFDLVGPFDEGNLIRYAEDNDWSHRALRAGVPIEYVPEIVVRHVHWRNKDQMTSIYHDYARSVGGFYGKHLRNGDLFIGAAALVDLTRAARRWIRGYIRSDRNLKANGFAYMKELFPGMLAGFRGEK